MKLLGCSTHIQDFKKLDKLQFSYLTTVDGENRQRLTPAFLKHLLLFMVSLLLVLTFGFTCQEPRLRSRFQHILHLVFKRSLHLVFIYRVEHCC